MNYTFPHKENSNFDNYSPQIWQISSRTYFRLLIFSILYNRIVGKLEDSNDGLSPFMVIIGVVMTIIISIPLTGVKATVSILKSFIVTGTPMTIGYLNRWAKRKSNGQQAINS